jgi:predicted nucleic acid-binding Zn ribbon protein
MRGRPPTRLGDALGSWLDKAGLRRRLDLAQAVEQWAATVGPQIAAVTRAEAVNAEGTLWVRVASSAWANELSLMAPRILAKLNQDRRGQLKEIRWLTGLPAPEPRQEG